jgi:hypothetical protein
MDDKLYQDDFEEFLQDQVRNHRMFPSDSIWRNIYKSLHGDKNWPALTIAAFALLIATVAVSIYFSPKPNIFAITPPLNNKKSIKGENLTPDFSSAPFLNQSKNNQPFVANNWSPPKTDAKTNFYPQDVSSAKKINDLLSVEVNHSSPSNEVLSNKAILPTFLNKVLIVSKNLITETPSSICCCIY